MSLRGRLATRAIVGPSVGLAERVRDDRTSERRARREVSVEELQQVRRLEAPRRRGDVRVALPVVRALDDFRPERRAFLRETRDARDTRCMGCMHYSRPQRGELPCRTIADAASPRSERRSLP